MISSMFFIALFMLGALGTEDLKKSITELETSAPSSHVYLTLSRSYLRDQEEEKAFKTFLKAVDLAQVEKIEMSSEETLLYNEALSKYLNNLPEEMEKVSVSLVEKYGPIVQEHPEYARLGLIVASAYANLKIYEPFFILFLKGYSCDPNHFLTHKALACIHVKLLERTKTEGDRLHEREIVLAELKKAQSANPQDFSLYRMEILFSPVKDRTERIKGILNKILTLPMIPTRKEALFFVELACETRDRELACKMVEKATKAFPDSRVIKQLKEKHGY